MNLRTVIAVVVLSGVVSAIGTAGTAIPYRIKKKTQVRFSAIELLDHLVEMAGKPEAPKYMIWDVHVGDFVRDKDLLALTKRLSSKRPAVPVTHPLFSKVPAVSTEGEQALYLIFAFGRYVYPPLPNTIDFDERVLSEVPETARLVYEGKLTLSESEE